MNIRKNVCHSLIQIIVFLLCFTNFNGARSQCNDVGDWVCDNGQCISEDKLCDGNVDCRDRSDEIAENCMQFHDTCQPFAFRCAYGACINGKARCNGVQDCADNSDELICTKKDDSDFQGSCSDIEMQCLTSRECIKSINLCDGRVDCKDGSDESLEVCINYGCISFGFQCGYGACINTNARCNGTRECADGSDEAWELCRTPRQPGTTNEITTPKPTTTPKPPPATSTTDQQCFIPNTADLQDMIIKHHPRNETIQLGSFVRNFNTIHIECKSKYVLRGQSSLLCFNGTFNSVFPTCLAYCNGRLLEGVSIDAICRYRSRAVKCVKDIRPETNIQINCRFGFTRTPDEPQYIKCLSDGTFDKKPQRCEQSCGRIASSLTGLSKNGVAINSSDAPWHVSIHESDTVSYTYICSGSILSPHIILTAAHCFWDEPTLTLRNYTTHKIIAGQNSYDFTTTENEFSQIVDVAEIQIPSGYRGKNLRQKDDIAFLKLTTYLRYSETIASICIPKDLRSTASNYMMSNRKGFINGFGETHLLERLNMITLSFHDCLEKSPFDARVADDKFCIYNNEGAAICRGDSGSAYFIEVTNDEGIDVTYRLLGVISNTPNTRSDCTLIGVDTYVAITYIYILAQDFKQKLEAALNADKELL